MTVDTVAIRTEMRVIRSYWEHGSISEQDTSATIERCFALLDALEAERERVRQLQNYLWRIRDAVMHEGGWCYDYETAEGKRIAEAVHVIWREARDAGLQPFATAKGKS